ncbi:ATP-binding protein [Clostridium grantii]|uniref:ATPase family associated with various cellular activities (AAA) n=1 Tax=Clostridium grantii DSM 8605 TaxID=1121316 RepID=A0A1M5Y6R2_9CLOT|nr:ATP-binding protein [Clostridium grantii]SHI07781.1 ATPase family associated with various cellular activities (AAA) [Clostridium grantii DSM 8605]
MNNYKFDTLNDEEFEEISKDLLREELDLDFRTFRKGRDGGVDLSYVDEENNKIVAQVKHYPKSNFSNLKSSLRDEYNKVKNKKFERYILITSLDLTVNQIKEIMKLMKGVIKSENDIYDLKKLNTLLQKKGNEWIETKYYKLWLSSATVLNRIINNAQENNIEYYVEGIYKKLKLYVITENFNKALNILTKTNMLLIHGEPGVGKTVLAEMLAYNYLNKGYKLKFISGNSVSELEKIMSPSDEEKEVVFIDDFLGSNFLELFTSTSENKMVFFLKKYIRKKNKIVILTTRSTIYNKGILQFEKFQRFSIEFEKYNLIITSYNDIDKAKILYNHLYFNEINQEYIDEIRVNNTFLKIIRHRNYTPRLIEFISNKRRIEKINASEYRAFILNNLDNPKEIWRNEFENKISDEDRFLIWSLFTFDNTVSEGILKVAFEERYDYEIKCNNFVRVHNAFEKSLNALSKGFLQINRSFHEKEAEISFINPSVIDFLINYLNKDGRERKRIFNSIKYLEQLDNFIFMGKRGYRDRVYINDDDRKVIKQRVIERLEDIKVFTDNKEIKICILKLILAEYKNDDSIKLTIKRILDEYIKGKEMDKEKLGVMIELINNRNIDLLEIDTLYKKNGVEGKIQDIILNQIQYIETFVKFLTLIRLNFSHEHNILLLDKKHTKKIIYSLCRQALADFVSGLLIYDECGAEDDDGNTYFDWDLAKELLEWKFNSFKKDILSDEELLNFNLEKNIEENIEDIFECEYGIASGDRLLEAIEEIWNMYYKENYNDSYYYSTYYENEPRISNMFKEL